jgi:uncharacterized protein
MPLLKRIVLDILKPHHPNALDFAKAIAGPGDRVMVSVMEVDEKTESVEVIVEGDDIRFDEIAATIANLGASLHSIDQVEVVGDRTEAK